MCGICGIVQVQGAPRSVVDEATLDRMTDLMTHRGPSDRGTYITDGVALGVRRLSIVDVEGGHQPVPNEDGSIWAVQNGELYNHLDLRRGLSGHRFRSRCDTDVLPHLYEEHGDALPEHLRGMFALAVWDERRRRLLLARDRLGIKPLYYARAGDLLVFASELKAVLASGLVGADLDYDALDAYLTLGYFPAPLTPLAAVRKLMPGHRLVVEDGKVLEQAFWRYPPPAPEAMGLDEAAERLEAKLEESVRLRLMSDVPIGAMLSGGLDSSLIVALMARNMSEAVKTFSVGFREDAESELADARQVASHFGTDHTELELSFNEDAVPFEDLVWHLDEPIAELSTLGFHALCGLAAQTVTVALSGQGADELLAGYRKHQAAWALGLARHVPQAAVRSVARLANFGPDTLRRIARTAAAKDPAERAMWMSGDLDDNRRQALFKGPLADVDGTAARRALEARLDGEIRNPLLASLYLDAQMALPDLMLHYFDRASMAHSLEVRVPFLDHEFVELCARVPAQHKIRRMTTKVVLRRMARGIVPDRIIDKPKIGFFAGAADGWLRTRLSADAGERLHGSQLRCGDFLNRAAVEQLARDFAAQRTAAPRSRLLLAVLMLEIWLSTYLPRATAGAAPAAVR
jgi:asparagine synthase (glutamine-hydrolysing)